MAEVRREIWIDAPPEAVYPFLVERELAAAWMGDESWNDPRPGGTFRLDIRGHLVSGEFVELDPPHRVVYTWGWEEEDAVHVPGSTTVEWTLEPERGQGRACVSCTRASPTTAPCCTAKGGTSSCRVSRPPPQHDRRLSGSAFIPSGRCRRAVCRRTLAGAGFPLTE